MTQLVGRPERAAAIDNLFAIFIDDGFDVDASRRGNGEVVGRVALTVGIHVCCAEFAFVQSVVIGLVLVTVVLLILRHPLVLLFDEI